VVVRLPVGGDEVLVEHAQRVAGTDARLPARFSRSIRRRLRPHDPGEVFIVRSSFSGNERA
jgi:hypothetical protein